MINCMCCALLQEHRGHHSKHNKEQRRPAHREHHSPDLGRRPIKQEPPDKCEPRPSKEERHGAHLRGGQDRQRSRSRHERQDGSFKRERERNDERRREAHRDRGDNPFSGEAASSNSEQWGVPSEEDANEQQPVDKDKPDFELSGKLTEDTNTYKGVVVKYNEPPEARKPKKKWRLYPFKGDEVLPVLHLHRQSAFLLGRERKVTDIPIDHPSCSKQHAALQFRLVPYEREDGSKGRRVCPYVIDLNSANGTYVNNQRIDPQRYVELMEKDVVKFGFSSREYVLLHGSSDTSELEGDDLGED